VATALPQSVSGQVGGEVHAAFVHGGQSGFRMTGGVGGGGVLIRNRFGIDAEGGLLGDSSDERVLAPVLAINAHVRLAMRRKVVPFAGAGFTRLGDWGGWHAGGGVDFAVSPRSAIRIEFRGAVPFADFSGCVRNARTDCALPPNAWFLRIGMAFGFTR
jgi:hypothetical protein